MIPFFDELRVRRLLEQKTKADKLNVVFTQYDEDEIFEKENLKIFLEKFTKIPKSATHASFEIFLTSSIIDYLIDSTKLTHDYSESVEDNDVIFLFTSKKPFCLANYKISNDSSSALFEYWFSKKERS